MSPLLALVLSAAPLVSVTTSDVKVDGKVVLAPIPDDAFLNLPPLEEALRARRTDGGPLECAIEAAPDVPFGVLKRVLFSCGSAGVRTPTFRVGAAGPFPVGPPAVGSASEQLRGSDVMLAVSPAAVTLRAPQGAPSVLAEPDGGVPSSAALQAKLGPSASSTWLMAVIEDGVRADRLAAVLTACRAAGVPDVRLSPASAGRAPDAGTPGLGGPVPGRPLGSLDKEQIRQVIHANRAAVRACYDAALGRVPGLAGKVAVHFVISPGGPVASASVAEDTVGDAPLAACITAAVQTWVFPKPKGDGVVVVTYPFIFKRAD